MSEYSISSSALIAYGDGLSDTAHNLANMNTPNFKAWSHTYSEVGSGGVRIDPYSQSLFLIQDRVDFTLDQNSEESEEIRAELIPPEGIDSNNVDYAREITNMIEDQRAFEANAAMIQSQQVLNLFDPIVDQMV